MRMLNYLAFLNLLISSFISIFTNEPNPNQVHNYYEIININSQKAYIERPQSELCCHDRINADFVECIFSLPVDDQKEVFKQLSSARKREYLRNLNYDQYKKFLKAYSEYDWKVLYNSLTKDEKAYWPKTVKEQLINLQRIKYKAEQDNMHMDIAMFAVGIIINPVINIAYQGYSLYKLLEENTHIIIDKSITIYFHEYMKTTFEI